MQRLRRENVQFLGNREERAELVGCFGIIFFFSILHATFFAEEN